MKKHTFSFPLPPGLNKQINEARSHWAVSAKTKRHWTDLIALESYEAPKFSGSVWIDFVWGVPRFDQDPDNVAAAAKFLLDGLKQAKVIKNDNLTVIQSPVIHWYERDRNNPGVLVTVSDSPSFLFERMRVFEQLSKAV